MSLYKKIELAIQQRLEELYIDGNVREMDIHNAIRQMECDNPELCRFILHYHFDYEKKTLYFKYKGRNKNTNKSICFQGNPQLAVAAAGGITAAIAAAPIWLFPGAAALAAGSFPYSFSRYRGVTGNVDYQPKCETNITDVDETDSQRTVYSSVFAPSEVKYKSHMLVQVYLHLFEEAEKVKSLALESHNGSERRDYIPLQCKLNQDDKVNVTLNIYGETLLLSEKKSVTWQGFFTKCSFDYFVPPNLNIEELFCVILLTVNEIPVGEMRFVTSVVNEPRPLHSKIIACKYNKVFISYSHYDESKVKFLHEGLELGCVPHFFDRHYLKAGDVFPQVIQDYINTADLFILCWSKNASKSEYVKKELLQALKRAFPWVQPPHAAKLSIYPVSIEPRAELPLDMKEYYHFGEL